MNPSTTKEDVDNRKVTSLSDEKTIGIFFGIFRKKWPNSKMSLQDAFIVTSMIDGALQQRHGQKSILSKDEWKKIRNDIAEAKISNDFNVHQLKSSLIPKETSVEDLSDSE